MRSSRRQRAPCTDRHAVPPAATCVASAPLPPCFPPPLPPSAFRARPAGWQRLATAVATHTHKRTWVSGWPASSQMAFMGDRNGRLKGQRLQVPSRWHSAAGGAGAAARALVPRCGARCKAAHERCGARRVGAARMQQQAQGTQRTRAVGVHGGNAAVGHIPCHGAHDTNALQGGGSGAGRGGATSHAALPALAGGRRLLPRRGGGHAALRRGAQAAPSRAPAPAPCCSPRQRQAGT